MPKLPVDLRPPRFRAAPPDPPEPLTLEDLAARIRRLESSGALEGATTSDGGMVINEFTIEEDGSLLGDDQPFFLTDVGRINSINSDPPDGDYGVTAGTDCTALDYGWAEGTGCAASGYASHAEGDGCTAGGDFGSHAEGEHSEASGERSHAEGWETLASGDEGAHSEGFLSRATGDASHAEGDGTVASGNQGAHSEGRGTVASGDASHAEGYDTEATVFAAHAEGFATHALGNHSHAEGYGAGALLRCEHAHSSTTWGQYSRLIVARATAGGAPARLNIMANSGGIGDPALVPAGELWMVTVEVAAKQKIGGVGLAGWHIRGLVGYPGGVLAVVDVPKSDHWGFGNGLTWDAQLDVDAGPPGVLAIRVTGQPGDTEVWWVATVHATRIYDEEFFSS